MPYDLNPPKMPPYAWPTYAPYNNYSRVASPMAYPYNAFPFIGPQYPFPKVPLGWRSVKLELEDGYWWFSKTASNVTGGTCGIGNGLFFGSLLSLAGRGPLLGRGRVVFADLPARRNPARDRPRSTPQRYFCHFRALMTFTPAASSEYAGSTILSSPTR